MYRNLSLFMLSNSTPHRGLPTADQIVKERMAASFNYNKHAFSLLNNNAQTSIVVD